MRKIFWYWTAAGFAAAGGIFAAAHHTWCPSAVPPSSSVKVAVPAACIGSECPSFQGEQDCNLGAPVTATEYPTPSPAPIVFREEDLPTAEASEVHEEGPAFASGCVIMCSGDTDTEPPPVADNYTLPCPMVMPYCHDEEPTVHVAPRMPHADEEVSTAPSLLGFWLGFFGSSGASQSYKVRMPKCEEDPHSSEHHSGCPYHGCCPASAVPPRMSHAPDDCNGQPCPKMHKVNYQGGVCPKEDCPRVPGVDTMEYRKSDGGLNEYGPGPY
jgi:hypothetical protein